MVGGLAVNLRRWLRPAAVPAPARPDISAVERATINFVKPFTLTGNERILAAIDAVKHIVRAKVPGAIVECGVWRGGSMMAMARTLLELKDNSRELYLYDTFTGMSAPTPEDVSHDGHSAAEMLADPQQRNEIACAAGLDEVRDNMMHTQYPNALIHYVEGKVEETIPRTIPKQIALLRLDTDWYESTKHELTHLYPLISRNGILIIDDYGHWSGASKAVDEYFENQNLYLHRIDYTGRLAVKP